MSIPRPDMPPFGEGDLLEDPIALFERWYELAGREMALPDAVCLATVDAAGQPDARMVLLKGVDDRGFRFFTNIESSKGRQLASHPAASLVFYWRELDRQVRIRGSVERLGEIESDEYFSTRPRESMVGAWASPQSRPLASRAELDELVGEIEARFDGVDVPRPPHWSGYLVVPDSIEFWQGQVGRLHDRFLYERDDDGAGWRWSRLGP